MFNLGQSNRVNAITELTGTINGTAVAQIFSSGFYNCTGSVVGPIATNPVNPQPYHFENYLPSTLRMLTACHDPGTQMSVINNGARNGPKLLRPRRGRSAQ